MTLESIERTYGSVAEYYREESVGIDDGKEPVTAVWEMGDYGAYNCEEMGCPHAADIFVVRTDSFGESIYGCNCSECPKENKRTAAAAG